MNLNVGLKDECAGLTEEIAGLKLRLQILAGGAAVATASGNRTEMRCLQMASLGTENEALKDRLEDIANLLGGDYADYYLGLDAGSSNKADDAEATADVDNVEAGEANEEENADAAAEVVDVDADEADEAYLREMEAYY